MAHRFIDHTGDTAVELTAQSEAELFRDATRALCSLFIDTGDETVAPRVARTVAVELEAEDGEALLIDYLNELIFLFDSQGLLPWELDVEEIDMGSPARLRGRLGGEDFDPGRHRFQTEVKAATFHDVEIRRSGGMISVIVVLDL